MGNFRGKNIQGYLNDAAYNSIFPLVGSGAPTNGTSGTGVNVAGPMSTYRDYTNNASYVNIGSKASPYWQLSTAFGTALTLRTRTAIAAVNAGATLLAAITGYTYRLIDAYAIAVGGAVGTVTTIDIIGTVSTARKLVAFGQASLTRSALVRAGSAGGVILADGASFTANDANTAITIGITGTAADTATHIDSQLTYVIEKA